MISSLSLSRSFTSSLTSVSPISPTILSSAIAPITSTSLRTIEPFASLSSLSSSLSSSTSPLPSLVQPLISSKSVAAQSNKEAIIPRTHDIQDDIVFDVPQLRLSGHQHNEHEYHDKHYCKSEETVDENECLLFTLELSVERTETDMDDNMMSSNYSNCKPRNNSYTFEAQEHSRYAPLQTKLSQVPRPHQSVISPLKSTTRTYAQSVPVVVNRPPSLSNPFECATIDDRKKVVYGRLPINSTYSSSTNAHKFKSHSNPHPVKINNSIINVFSPSLQDLHNLPRQQQRLSAYDNKLNQITMDAQMQENFDESQDTSCQFLLEL